MVTANAAVRWEFMVMGDDDEALGIHKIADATNALAMLEIADATNALGIYEITDATNALGMCYIFGLTYWEMQLRRRTNHVGKCCNTFSFFTTHAGASGKPNIIFFFKLNFHFSLYTTNKNMNNFQTNKLDAQPNLK